MTLRNREIQHRPVSHRGVILSHTTLYDVPSSHSAQAPLQFALVRLENNTQILAQLTDIGNDISVAIGDEVEMVTRILTTEGARGVIVYGYKFRPVLQEANPANRAIARKNRSAKDSASV